MKGARALLGAAGLSAFGLGIASLAVPGIAAAAPAAAAVSLLGTDYLLVAPLGVAAAGVVAAVLGRRAVRGVDQATPPDPERVPTAPAPGAAFDERVSRRVPLCLRPGERERIRERLHEAAVRTISRSTGCPPADARRRVERGTWTDDPAAAAFLADEDGRLGAGRRARRTVAAIERAGTGERP